MTRKNSLQDSLNTLKPNSLFQIVSVKHLLKLKNYSTHESCGMTSFQTPTRFHFFEKILIKGPQLTDRDFLNDTNFFYSCKTAIYIFCTSKTVTFKLITGADIAECAEKNIQAIQQFLAKILPVPI